MIDLTKLHTSHFVIVPGDKAPKNVGIIYKSFYLQVLNNDFTVHDIVSKYSSILKEKHNNSFKHSNLPFI